MNNFVFNDTINLEVNDKSYLLKYPTVGQVLMIENLKIVLSGGIYAELANNSTVSTINLLNLIDAVAYFTVLSEEMTNDFNLKQFDKIDIRSQVQLRTAFTEQFWPWYNDIETKLLDEIKEK